MVNEIHSRESDGITVTLWFDSDTREVSCSVKSASQDFTIRDIHHPLALDVFYHPFAYASAALVGRPEPLGVAA